MPSIEASDLIRLQTTPRHDETSGVPMNLKQHALNYNSYELEIDDTSSTPDPEDDESIQIADR